MTDGEDEEVARLTEALLTGRKIEAIKIYRERTGCGLKEAKDEVEALEADLRTRHPEKFSAERKTAGGCAGMVLLVTATIATIAACTASAAGLGVR